MPAGARLRLLCHAPTAAIRTSAFPNDEPLDAQAQGRLSSLSFRVSPADLCLTSPALRARQTAQDLGIAADVEPLLRDCDYGRWAGRTFDEVQHEEPEAIDEWLRDPAAAPHGGESIVGLIARVAQWLDMQRAAPERIVAITHAAVIRAAIVHALGAPPLSFWRIDITPLSLVRLSGANGRWTLASLGRIEARDEDDTIDRSIGESGSRIG
jgi:broad specificity phosphatase PhoE